MRHHPHLYEISARLFIRRISQKYGRTFTLATIPDEEWQLMARRGFDFVWLMGVWERSPGGRQKALRTPALRGEYDRVLPGWTEEDVAGSPYAIYAYTLDPALGRHEELAQLRSKLNQQGIGLLLDFVPNHLAFDHPWAFSHPEWFVQGRKADVRTHSDWFYASDRGIYLAHGRDPNFPPWTDTVQVNFYSAGLRQALISELQQIAEVADGVRCDMAMLALNDIFEQTWGGFVTDYPRPQMDFWTEAIGRVKQKRPDFLFLAEVYWGLERKLQQMGFDFTYDKTLYDKLRFSTAEDIRSHLMIDELYQKHSARFIENHDEDRAVVAFGRERSLAAAVVLATAPGLRLFHDGQLEGRRIHLPIQLVRQPEETVDSDMLHFYEQLLTVCRSPAFHDGVWRLMEVSQVGQGNDSHQNFLAWCWRYAKQFKIVVVNYSPKPARGQLRLPLPPEIMGEVILSDELTHITFVPDANQVGSHGLYLDLKPWQAQILDMPLS